jgi:FkbM family methyltransferase
VSPSPPAPLPVGIRALGRRLLRAWGFFPKAPGYYYQAVERWGPRVAVTPLDCRLFNGARVRCDLRDHVQRHMYFFGAYEPIDAYLFRALAQPGMVVVDAGGNVGQYSLIAALEVGRAGAVHAFEPVPRNFDRLVAHVHDNGLASTVRANMLALWHEPATLDLHRLVDGGGDNDGAFTAGPATTVLETSRCRAVRLDDYASDVRMERLDLMKVDVEGAELFVLRGGTSVLRRWRPTILMEINRALCEALGYAPEAIWEVLEPLGYRIWSIGHSAEACRPRSNLSRIDRANVIFHVDELPRGVTRGWSQKRILRTHRWNAGW